MNKYVILLEEIVPEAELRGKIQQLMIQYNCEGSVQKEEEMQPEDHQNENNTSD